ncbi:MAG: hypothetical protein LBC61_05085 [Candidatus Peribacteria bacterium]|nr:hypothetical protein [Candidatus Peribacteria bacterium]
MSISEARNQAIDLEIFDNSKRFMILNNDVKKVLTEEAREDENSLLENDLEPTTEVEE